jgi:MSHA biogenesis protein MshN
VAAAVFICIVKSDFTAVVERVVMSIINKMHQDLQQAQPMLASMPEKRSKQKALILLVITLLLGTSIALAYLIFSQQKTLQESEIHTVKTQSVETEDLVAPKVTSKVLASVVQKKQSVEPLTVNKAVPKEFKTKALAPAITVNNAVVEKKKKIESKKVFQQTVSAKTASTEIASTNTASINKAKALPVKTAPVTEQKSEQKQLEIKVSQLSKAELAQLHIKEADKAQAQGDFEVALKKKLQALALQPHLNELRKSLALYYYGQGDVDRAQRLLQKGVRVSPDYPDFNLMLSRIALKEGNQQKAYLYLEQNPPQVEGNIDYYVSHAILAQKFQKYEQSEILYISLLTQRPNNGRWRMSLAIVQDRQNKIDLAVNNYKQALLKTDLSSKAKVYINQRLAYLGQN